jgi:lysyl-tRNA synthetase class II
MEHHLTTPVREEDVRKLRMGDLVYVTGTVITARDEAHLKALELREKGEDIRDIPLRSHHEEGGRRVDRHRGGSNHLCTDGDLSR